MYLHALIPATLAFSVQVHSLAVKPFSSESPMVYDVSATVPYLAPNSVLTRDGRGMVDSGISAVAIHVINSMATVRSPSTIACCRPGLVPVLQAAPLSQTDIYPASYSSLLLGPTSAGLSHSLS